MRAAICAYIYWCCGYHRLNPGPVEEEEMDAALPANLEREFRKCQNIKSRSNPDVQCPYLANHGDYCSRHSKNPRPFQPLSVGSILEEGGAASPKAAQVASSKIQKAWRVVRPLLRFRQQGPAANALYLANNETELYTLDSIKTIPQPYLFTFADERKRIWAFDIRTLSHTMAAGFQRQNPYTRDPLSEEVMAKLHQRIQWLRARKYQILHVSNEVLTAEQAWNQKVLDIFLKIEALGYYVSCEWFHRLTVAQHEHFYKRLLLLWDWRLGLTSQEKELIVPGHSALGPGRLFRFPFNELPYKERAWWERHNLALIESFITRAGDKEQQKLGALYCLMALVQVSREAARALHWIVEAVRGG